MIKRTILLIVLGSWGLACARESDIDKSSYFVVTDSRPKAIDSAKKAQIKNGMSLKQVVVALGPGWMPRNEGVGIISWLFDDGSALYITPHWYDNEVVTYKGENGTTQMRWVR